MSTRCPILYPRLTGSHSPRNELFPASPRVLPHLVTRFSLFSFLLPSWSYKMTNFALTPPSILTRSWARSRGPPTSGWSWWLHSGKHSLSDPVRPQDRGPASLPVTRMMLCSPALGASLRSDENPTLYCFPSSGMGLGLCPLVLVSTTLRALSLTKPLLLSFLPGWLSSCFYLSQAPGDPRSMPFQALRFHMPLTGNMSQSSLFQTSFLRLPFTLQELLFFEGRGLFACLKVLQEKVRYLRRGDLQGNQLW